MSMPDATVSAPDSIAVEQWGRAHLIAIGGAGMSVIAQLLLDCSVPVQGSDRDDSATLRALEQAGARVWVGHDAAHVTDADVVIVSSAIKEDNPELAAARRAGKTVLHRSQALAALSEGNSLIAVAGAHGKTTTSAMIAVALRALGRDPSIAVGSTIQTPHGAIPGGHAGQDPLMVIEADESDGSFLNYRPTVAVVTNIEPDHLDHYRTVTEFEQAFSDFARQITASGLLVTSADDPGTRRLTAQLKSEHSATDQAPPRVVTFGRAENADYRIQDTAMPGEGCLCEATIRTDTGQTVRLRLQVPGIHNVLNATAALAVLVDLGFDPAAAARSLGAFTGTGRRFDLRGEVDGIRVIDDYAHHPTEVAALLTATKAIIGSGRVIAVFQPHLYSRTQTFAAEFAQALQLADAALVCDVYAARENYREDVGPQTIVAAASDGAVLRVVADKHEAGRQAAFLAEPGDVIVLIGAGDITTIGDEVIDQLTSRWLKPDAPAESSP